MITEKSHLASIIINNYNYGSFISEAIDSALNQTYPNIEVVVVDDGSSDNSRQVIASYGEKIVPVLKENGGQGSACNAGFAISKGEIVIFLDSDDILLPEIVQHVVDAFKSDTNVVKVQYRLQIMDANGQITDFTVPSRQWHMPSGDIREQLLKNPNYIWPPTSGNAFTAKALRQIVPIPEALFRASADIYLNDLAVMFGSLVSLEEAGAFYRIHGKNYSNTSSLKNLDLNKLRTDISRIYAIHEKRQEIIRDLYPNLTIDTVSKDNKLFVGKTISLKLDPENHPIKENLFLLCWRGFIYSLLTHQSRPHVGLLMSLWFVGMFFAPKPVAQFLADNLLDHEKRGNFINKLRSVVQMIG